MKKFVLLSIPSIVIATLLMLGSCVSKKEKIEFSGYIISNSGKPVADAKIQVNKIEATSDKEGKFSVSAEIDPSEYLITISKFGFGLYSKKFSNSFKDKKIFLSEGTIIEFDPSTEITLVDGNSGKNPFMPALLSSDTAKLFKIVPKVYDHEGKLIDLGFPEEVKNIFNFLKLPITGSRGLSLTIPGNALVDNNGNQPQSGSKLRASLSTVDFFNPDGMPGDFTVRLREGFAYMETFGAGTIEIFDGESKYQLKKGQKARLEIPIYPMRLQLKEEIPKVISLLYYNEKDGNWYEEGNASLNDKGDAYIAEIEHFSVVNMDIIKSGPSRCLKFRQMVNGGTYLANYQVNVLIPNVPSVTSFTEKAVSINEATGCVRDANNNTRLHPVVRLPDTFTVLVFSQDTDNNINTVNNVIDIAIERSGPGLLNNSLVQAASCDNNGDLNFKTDCDPNCGVGLPDPNTDVSSACNTSCWLTECGFVPFENISNTLNVVSIVKDFATKKVILKWVCNDPTVVDVKILQCTDLPDCQTDCSLTSGACNCVIDYITGGTAYPKIGEVELTAVGAGPMKFTVVGFGSAPNHDPIVRNCSNTITF